MSRIIDRYFTLHAEYLASVAEFFSLPSGDREITRHARDGALKLVDAIYLQERLQATQPGRILEIGSFLGFSTRWLLEASQAWDAAVLSVDPGLRHRNFDRPRSHLRHFCAGFASRLDLIDACLCEKNESMFMHDYITYEPRLSPRDALVRMDAVPILSEPFGTFDFAFIDGDHSFEATVANVRLVSRMMPSGGTIVVHDAFSWPEVEPALAAVCSDEPGLSFVGTDGNGFHRGVDRLADISACDALPLKAPFSDGLGIVLVSPGADEAAGL